MIAHTPAVPATPTDAGTALHVALVAEARAVLAEVLAVPSDALDVALAVHSAAGKDVDDVSLSVLADVLTS